MCSKKLSKFDQEYLKKNYITEFKIDDKNKKVIVYYIDGESYSFPLTARVLSNVKSNMRSQYDEWKDMIKRVYMLHPVKLLYLNIALKKQKFFLEHESEFSNCNVKKDFAIDKLSKKEVDLMNREKGRTHSYFNLSSVTRYKLSTMKKVHKIISAQSENSKKSK